MTQSVALPDGSTATFDDDIPLDVIQRVIQQHLTSASAPQPPAAGLQGPRSADRIPAPVPAQGQAPAQGGGGFNPLSSSSAPSAPPVPASSGYHPFSVNPPLPPGVHGYTGPEEFAKGVPQGALSVGDMPHDLSSLADQSLSLFTTSGQAPGIPLIPKLGAADAYARAVPVTPGYEDWRDAGDATGNFVTTEALSGGVGGLLSGSLRGARAAETALNIGKNAVVRGGIGGIGSSSAGYVGEKGGELIDMPEAGKTVGNLIGGTLPALFERRIGTSAIKNWSDADTVARAAAMERLGVKPSIAAIGNDRARQEVTPLFSRPVSDFEQQLADLNAQTTAGRDAVRGTTAPLTDTSVGATGAQAQAAATKAAATATAGKNALLDPIWARMRSDQALNADNTFMALNDAIKTSTGDTEAMLTQARNDLLTQARKSGWTPNSPNLTLTPDLFRKWGSDLKQLRSPSNRALAANDLKPVTDAVGADQESHFAKVGGNVQDFRDANAAAAPYYDDRAVAQKVLGNDPATKLGQSANKVGSSLNLQSPEILAALARRAPAETAQLKGTLLQRGLLDADGNISPKTGEWWNSLPEGQKANLSNNNPVLRQQFDDIALVSKGMKAPTGRLFSGINLGLGSLTGGGFGLHQLLSGGGSIVPTLLSGAAGLAAPAIVRALKSSPAALEAMRTGAARSWPSVAAPVLSAVQQSQRPPAMPVPVTLPR